MKCASTRVKKLIAVLICAIMLVSTAFAGASVSGREATDVKGGEFKIINDIIKLLPEDVQDEVKEAIKELQEEYPELPKMTVEEAYEAGALEFRIDNSREAYEYAYISDAVIDEVMAKGAAENILATKEELKDAPKGLKTLVDFADFSFVIKGTPFVVPVENVEITWTEAVTKDMKADDIYILHYDNVAGKYEIFNPKAVDGTKSTLSADFKTLSPVAILYMPAEEVKPTATPTETTAPTAAPTAKPTETPKTGDTAPIALYSVLAVAAMVAVGSSLVLRKRAK